MKKLFLSLILLLFTALPNAFAANSTALIAAAASTGIAIPPVQVVLLTEFPQPQLWINMMPVVDPEATPSTYAALTIVNHTSRNLVYHFGSGQQFDITLANAQGEIVSLWSRDKFFIQIATQITIPPGGAQRFGGTIDLLDDKGQPLQPGGYTLAIGLTSYGKPGSSHTPGSEPINSQTPVRIDWLY